jgi:perosamine synthetase
MARVIAEGTARQTCLPYGRQSIDEEDIAAVVAVLRSEWLTTGPAVDALEREFALVVGTREAVAVSSGTAALHASMFAMGIGPGDEVIVPAITFAATANAVVYQGGYPVFADVHPETLLVDPVAVERCLTPNTRCIIGVDYAGQPCEYDRLRTIAARRLIRVVADACHALGASVDGRPVGSLAELSAFSLHPVKPITSGEGGVVTTDDPVLASRMRTFRNHGITTDQRQREEQGSWFYEMAELGYNYRLSDIHCGLALSQLRKLPMWVQRRRAIAAAYDAAFAPLAGVRPLRTRPGVEHAHHLYVVQLAGPVSERTRARAFAALRARGIGVNVHYVPVYLHPFYRKRFGTRPGLCPVAEEAYERILTLPLFPTMTDQDVDDVVRAVAEVCVS